MFGKAPFWEREEIWGVVLWGDNFTLRKRTSLGTCETLLFINILLAIALYKRGALHLLQFIEDIAV